MNELLSLWPFIKFILYAIFFVFAFGAFIVLLFLSVWLVACYGAQSCGV